MHSLSSELFKDLRGAHEGMYLENKAHLIYNHLDNLSVEQKLCTLKTENFSGR